jgi:hypothetical protein
MSAWRRLTFCDRLWDRGGGGVISFISGALLGGFRGGVDCLDAVGLS